MPLTAISIEGYRSVRRLYLPIGDLSVFVGSNGVGKTNLYNALALLRAAAEGTITRAIAQEGGVGSSRIRSHWRIRYASKPAPCHGASSRRMAKRSSRARRPRVNSAMTKTTSFLSRNRRSSSPFSASLPSPDGSRLR
ncbi:MAG: AAA family ATPase [Alphaproteobacteria bacterium]|nr:AAA family ATPase [Alphaproteobacteria bacterium]MBL6940441.1 AAA family ATPase [Alphaproteobacteria bacterium]MBL7099688.1 AAA family ATPase [Alphaproteobacteria bacterium]